MMPIRRDVRFKLPRDRLLRWHGRGRPVSHFFNALSVFFPEGERFFISSVRNYRSQVRSPELQQAVTAFIGQEAMHGREHEDYNALLVTLGMPADTMNTFVARVLNLVRLTPKSWQLSTTLALEHFTAILADRLLSNPKMLEGADSEIIRLWTWHALEETEHKAVAYDVWNETIGDDSITYALRCAGMLLTATAFFALVAGFTAIMIETDRARLKRRPSRAAAYRELAAFLIGQEGLLRSGFKEWLTYFSRDFHPWRHDNRTLLNKLDELFPAPSATAPVAEAA